jgi:hypothetical protein
VPQGGLFTRLFTRDNIALSASARFGILYYSLSRSPPGVDGGGFRMTGSTTAANNEQASPQRVRIMGEEETHGRCIQRNDATRDRV